MEQDIQSARAGNAKAILKLIQRGTDVLLQIAHVMEQRPNEVHSSLASVIRAANGNDSLPILSQLAGNLNYQISVAACCALAKSQASQAIQILEQRLSVPSRNDRYLGPVFLTIGNRFNQSAGSIIYAFLKRIFGDFPEHVNLHAFLLDCIRTGDEQVALTIQDAVHALIQLGDNRTKEQLALLLKTGNRSEMNPIMSVILAKATTTLAFLPSNATVSILAELRSQPYWEIRQNAVKTLFLIGTSDVIEPLMLYLDDEDYQSRYNALVYIWKILGRWPAEISEVEDINIEKIRNWWIKTEVLFEKEVVLRNGRPIDYGLLVNGLKDKYFMKEYFDQIAIYLGLPFEVEDFVPIEQQWQLAAHATSWWSENEKRFLSGHHYRMGRELMFE